MKRLKILQCLVFYLPNRIGGIEVYVHALSRQLHKLGHEVKILVPAYPGEKEYAPSDEGIPILTYPGFFNELRQEYRGNIPGKNIPGFTACLEKEKPDVVHFHQLTSSDGISLFHLEAASRLGIRIIFTNHLAGLTCQTGKLLYRDKELCDGIMRNTRCAICALERFGTASKIARTWSYRQLIKEKRKKVETLLQLADRMIVLTDWYYEILSRNKFPLDKVRIIKQGLPAKLSSPKRGDHAAQKPIRIVFIGRIYPDKGLLILLQALSAFSEKIFALDIFGQVDDREYEKECRALGSHNRNIRWHGQLFYKEVMDVIGQYDLLVLPSMIAEMAPLVSREAFAAGIPVIGTDVGGIAEEVRNGENGFLFEMGNVDQLRGILKRISDDPSLLNQLYKQLPVPRSFEEVARETEAEYYAVMHNQ